MRKKKTPWNKRNTYKFYDEEGRQYYEFNPETDKELEVTIERKREIVRELHAMDDHDVYVESKEMKVPNYIQEEVKKQREDYIRKFTEEYGYPPKNDEIPVFSHRTVVSLEDSSETDNDDPLGDSSKVEEAIAVRPFEEEPDSAVDRMRSIVDGFTEKERQVYDLCFREGIRNNRASEILNISEVRVGQIARNIKKKLAGNSELKKYFRVI